MDKNNKLSYSTFWEDNYNPEGVNPPNPQFKMETLPSYIQLPTELTGASISVIQSKREPYAAEHMNTQYGQLSTRVGTNIGLKN